MGNRSEVRLLDGHDDLEVVGESYYQENLWRLVGARRRDERVRYDIHAVLAPEDDNPYDANAVAVWVHGLKVGHLSRSNARRYRPGLLSLATVRPTSYEEVCCVTVAAVVSVSISPDCSDQARSPPKCDGPPCPGKRSGAGIAGTAARTVVTRNTAGGQFTITTGKNGRFQLSSPPGTYRLTGHSPSNGRWPAGVVLRCADNPRDQAHPSAQRLVVCLIP